MMIRKCHVLILRRVLFRGLCGLLFLLLMGGCLVSVLLSLWLYAPMYIQEKVLPPLLAEYGIDAAHFSFPIRSVGLTECAFGPVSIGKAQLDEDLRVESIVVRYDYKALFRAWRDGTPFPIRQIRVSGVDLDCGFDRKGVFFLQCSEFAPFMEALRRKNEAAPAPVKTDASDSAELPFRVESVVLRNCNVTFHYRNRRYRFQLDMAGRDPKGDFLRNPCMEGRIVTEGHTITIQPDPQNPLKVAFSTELDLSDLPFPRVMALNYKLQGKCRCKGEFAFRQAESLFYFDRLALTGTFPRFNAAMQLPGLGPAAFEHAYRSQLGFSVVYENAPHPEITFALERPLHLVEPVDMLLKFSAKVKQTSPDFIPLSVGKHILMFPSFSAVEGTFCTEQLAVQPSSRVALMPPDVVWDGPLKLALSGVFAYADSAVSLKTTLGVEAFPQTLGFGAFCVRSDLAPDSPLLVFEADSNFKTVEARLNLPHVNVSQDGKPFLQWEALAFSGVFNGVHGCLNTEMDLRHLTVQLNDGKSVQIPASRLLLNLNDSGNYWVDLNVPEVKTPYAELEDIGFRMPFAFDLAPDSRLDAGTFYVGKINAVQTHIGGFEMSLFQQGMHVAYQGMLKSDRLKIPLEIEGRAGRFEYALTPVPFWGNASHVYLRNYVLPPETPLKKWAASFGDACGGGIFNLEGHYAVGFPQTRNTLSLRVDSGMYVSETNHLRLENVALDVSCEQTPTGFKTPSNQTLAFERASLGAVKLSRGKLAFRVDEGWIPQIESLIVDWCRGSVRSLATKVDPKHGAYAISLYCDRLNVGDLLSEIGFASYLNFEGDAAVSGLIPVTYADGKFELGDGFLYTAPGIGGTLHLKTAKTFSSEFESGTELFSQVDLATEALKSFDYDWIRINLGMSRSSPDLPDPDAYKIGLTVSGRPDKKLPFGLSKDGRIERMSAADTAAGRGSTFRGIEVAINLITETDAVVFVTNISALLNDVRRFFESLKF